MTASIAWATTTYPDSSTEALTYDLDSNVTLRCTRAGLPIAFTYDTLNRLGTKTAPVPPTTCATAPAGTVVTYAYDLAGRRTGVSDTSAAIQAIATPGSSIQYSTSMTYDALNRPTGVSWTPAAAAVTPASASSVAFTHSYNAVNQRVGQAVSDNSWISYPAATAGTTGYTANNLNQYTAVGAASPTYDGNGNTTFDGTYTLGYDPENRLVSASGGGNTASYAFDGRGRRKAKTVNGTTTVFITDADNREVLEYDGGIGAIIRWYAYGLGPNAVLNQMGIASGTRATFLPDQLGSIIGSMDAGTATLTAFAYRPYGSSAAPPAQFGFTGQRFDAESGFYYYRARQYSPGWGRFLQADPIGYSGGMNLYAYADNNPLNQFDPTGNCPWCVAALVGALTGAAIDLGVQLVQNGGAIGQVNWTSVGVSAAAGAVFSGLGPSGWLLGRGGARAAQFGYDQAPGLLNSGAYRFGWSYNAATEAEVLSARIGSTHFDLPFISSIPGANPIGEGLVAGAGSILFESTPAAGATEEPNPYAMLNENAAPLPSQSSSQEK